MSTTQFFQRETLDAANVMKKVAPDNESSLKYSLNDSVQASTAISDKNLAQNQVDIPTHSLVQPISKSILTQANLTRLSLIR